MTKNTTKLILAAALSAAFSLTAHADGVLDIGSDITFAPFESYDADNNPIGFDIELMQAVAKQMGMTANFKDTRFTNLIPGIAAKRFPVAISAMYITKDRVKVVDMIPYFKGSEALVVKKGSTYQPQGAEDLCGHIIGTQKGTAYVQQLTEISKNTCEANGKDTISVREFPTMPQATQALLAGNVEAEYNDAAVSTAAVKQLNGRVEISVTKPFYPVVGGIVVAKNNTEMQKSLTDALAALEADGTYPALLKKYGLTKPTQADVDNILK